jgi:hypothetical protein
VKTLPKIYIISIELRAKLKEYVTLRNSTITKRSMDAYLILRTDLLLLTSQHFASGVDTTTMDILSDVTTNV